MDEQQIFDNVFGLVDKKGLYSVLALLESKSFHRSFGLRSPMASSVGNTSEGLPIDGTSTSLSNADESLHSRDEQI